MVAGQNICSAAREGGRERGLTSRRTSLCVYLGNNYVNGFSSLPACLSACSAHPPSESSGQSCSLSFSFTIPLWRSLRANMMYSLFLLWNLSVWETWRSGRPTNKCRRGMSLADDGCASCQRLLPTCDTDADGRADEMLLLSFPPLHVRPTVRPSSTPLHLQLQRSPLRRRHLLFGNHRPGAVSEGRTRFGSTVRDI